MENKEIHEICASDLLKWRNEHRVLFASCSKSGKSLYATLNASYEIEVNGEIVYKGCQSFPAILKYNSIK